MHRFFPFGLVLVSAVFGQTLHHPPFQFEANEGQSDSRLPVARGRDTVRALSGHRGVGPGQYIARGLDTVVSLTGSRASIAFPGATVAVQLAGANPTATAEGVRQLPGVVNYYIGGRSHWREGVPTYEAVLSRGIYPGIDILYYSAEDGIEYDFTVGPHADPGRIRLAFQGARDLRIEENGDLAVRTAAGGFRNRRPAAWQEKNGSRIPVEAHYTLRSRFEAAFEVGDYDATLPLVIDPVLELGGFLGGSAEDTATSAMFLGMGDSAITVVAGATNSVDFQGRTTSQGGFDAFVMALDFAGRPLYTTYLGGSGDDRVNAISVDGDTLAVAGETSSQDFPVIASPAGNLPQSAYGGGARDAFVAELVASTGVVRFASYLGGSGDDRATGVSVDSSGRIVVAGETGSPDFPVRNAIQAKPGGGTDAFVAEYDGARRVLFSTYLGGSGDDRAHGVAVASDGAIYLAGETGSSDFPVANALQPARGGAIDAFLAKLAADGSSLEFSTYLGGSGDDRANAVALDPDGNPYLAGSTASMDFPAPAGQHPVFAGGATDAFLAHVSADGAALLSSAYIGGTGDDEALALAVPAFGDVYLAGRTSSTDFPTHNPLQASFGGGAEDAFLIHMAADGTVFHSTYYGGSGAERALGIAVDPDGCPWVVGPTSSADLPRMLEPESYHGGVSDAFFAKISDPILVAGNMVIGKNLQKRLDVELSLLPYGGITTATITSSDSTKVLFSSDPGQAGSATLSVASAQSLLALAPIWVQALGDAGVVTYTMTAPGFPPRTGRITLAPSGFALTPGSFTASVIAPQTIQVNAAYLDPATGAAVIGESLRAGADPVALSVASSNPSVGGVPQATLFLEPGQSAAPTLFQAKQAGTTTLSLGVPAGYTPLPDSSAVATVLSHVLQATDVQLGKDLQAAWGVQLGEPAPAGGLDITVTSAAPGAVLVSADQSRMGAASATVKAPAGAMSATFYLQGLAATGGVRLTATASGFPTVSATANLTPSGFYFTGGDLTATVLSGDHKISITSGPLDPGTMAPLTEQALRPGAGPVTVDVTSSDVTVATITQSPVTFRSGDGPQTTAVRPVGIGTAVVSLSTPQGFAAPSPGRSIQVSLSAPSLKITNQNTAGPLVVGKDLEGLLLLTLSDPAPSGGLPVTISSSDPSLVLVSAVAFSGQLPGQTVGSGQFTQAVAAGAGSIYIGVQGLASTGSVVVTAAAPGFNGTSAIVTLGPSGFYMVTNFDRLPLSDNTTAVAEYLNAYALDSNGSAVAQQYLRPGVSLSIEIQSSAPEVAVVAPDPVTVVPGSYTTNVYVQTRSVGTTVLSFVQPPGFTTPMYSTGRTLTVTPPQFNATAYAQTVGKDLQYPIQLQPTIGLQADHTITVTSGDPGKLVLSADPGAPGSGAITLQPDGLKFYVQALADSGAVPFTVSTAGFDDLKGTVTLAPSGFVFDYYSNNGTFGAVTGFDWPIRVCPSTLHTTTYLGPCSGQSMRGGLSPVTVNIANSNPAAGTLEPATITFNPGDATLSTSFHPLAPGTTQLEIQTPAGFIAQPPSVRTLTVNVTAGH